MKKSWTIPSLVAVGSLAALDIIVGLAASVITTTTGITMASGAITSITEPLLLMVALLVIERRGTATIFMSIVAVLALPLNYGGPPGFVAKVPIMIILGVICDILYVLLSRLSIWLAATFIGGFLCLWYAFAVAFVGRLLKMPGIDNFLSVMPIPYLVVLLFIIGAIGGILGVLLHKRIKNTAVVQRIQGK